MTLKMLGKLTLLAVNPKVCPPGTKKKNTKIANVLTELAHLRRQSQLFGLHTILS
jgi:hypothetical protein